MPLQAALACTLALFIGRSVVIGTATYERLSDDFSHRSMPFLYGLVLNSSRRVSFTIATELVPLGVVRPAFALINSL